MLPATVTVYTGGRPGEHLYTIAAEARRRGLSHFVFNGMLVWADGPLGDLSIYPEIGFYYLQEPERILDKLDSRKAAATEVERGR